MSSKKKDIDLSFQMDELMLDRLTLKERHDLYQQIIDDPELQKEYQFTKALLQYFSEEKEADNKKSKG